MTQSRRSVSLLAFAVLSLALYLAVQIARAQDIATGELPTEAGAVIVPTDEPPVEIESVTTPIEPANVVNPPVEAAVEQSSDVTPVSTELPAVDVPTTDVPVLPAASEPTLLPTDDLLITDVPATPAASEPTQLPTDDPLLTLVPTIQVAVTNIIIQASMTRVLEDNRLTLTVSGEGLADVYDVSLACQVDPNLLQGVQALTGDWLLTNQSSVTDSGIQADGLWILLGKQVAERPEAASAGTLWTMEYQVVGTGAAEIICLMQASDLNNQPISLVNFNPVLSVDLGQGVDDGLMITPTITPEPTLLPAIEEVIASTDSPAVVPIVVTESIEQPWVHVYGRVESLLPLTNATITISGHALNQVIAVQPNGAFGFDLPAGEYQFTFDALYCLQVALPVVLTGEPIKLPIVTLIGGDVDGNYIVDTMDASLVSQNFGLFAHVALSAADINQDGIVNIYDLALVSASIPSE